MDTILLGYLGPDTLLPVASVSATILGVIMMFWRNAIQAVRFGVRFVARSTRRLLGTATD